MSQQLSISEQKMNQLTESLEEQKKSVIDSAELLRDVIIRIGNLVESVKNMQKEMDYWRNPEVMEAKEGLNHLHDEKSLSIYLLVKG